MSSDAAQHGVARVGRAAERPVDSGNPYLVDMRTLDLLRAGLRSTIPPLPRPQEPNNAAAGAARGAAAGAGAVRSAGGGVVNFFGAAHRIVSKTARDAKTRKKSEKREEELHQMRLQKHNMEMRGIHQKQDMSKQRHDAQIQQQRARSLTREKQRRAASNEKKNTRSRTREKQIRAASNEKKKTRSKSRGPAPPQNNKVSESRRAHILNQKNNQKKQRREAAKKKAHNQHNHQGQPKRGGRGKKKK